MKITINISKKTAKHIRSPHSFMNECSEACDVLYEVQRKVNLILAKRKHTK